MADTFRLNRPRRSLGTRYVHHAGQLRPVLEVPAADWPQLPAGSLLFVVLRKPGSRCPYQGQTVAGHLSSAADGRLHLALDGEAPALALTAETIAALLYPLAAPATEGGREC